MPTFQIITRPPHGQLAGDRRIVEAAYFKPTDTGWVEFKDSDHNVVFAAPAASVEAVERVSDAQAEELRAKQEHDRRQAELKRQAEKAAIVLFIGHDGSFHTGAESHLIGGPHKSDDRLPGIRAARDWCDKRLARAEG